MSRHNQLSQRLGEFPQPVSASHKTLRREGVKVGIDRLRWIDEGSTVLARRLHNGSFVELHLL